MVVLTLQKKQGFLTVHGFKLKWVKSLTFVGTIINFSGNDGEAIVHRLAQAAKSLAAWRQFLRFPRVALKKRLKLLISTVFASALWLSETWLPTKRQREHLTSWGARMASNIAGFSQHLAGLNVAQFGELFIGGATFFLQAWVTRWMNVV